MNAMEYFRMGAEKRKAEALKNNSLYNLENGNGEDLAKLESRARRIGENPIVKSRIKRGKATPRFDRAANEYAQAVSRAVGME